jgi:protein TonB
MERAEADAGEETIVPSTRRPLLRMLLLSLALHGAVLMIVQPREFPPLVEDNVVIAARLLESAPASEPSSEPESPPIEPDPILPETLPEPIPSPEPVPEPVPDPVSVLPPAKAATAEPKPAPVSAAAPEVTKVPDKLDLPSIPVMVDTTWYELKKTDRPPKRLTPLDTTYPPGPLRDGIEGRVKVKLWINEFGELTDAEVVESRPPGVFDEAALAAVKKSRYQAAEKDGRPIRVISYSVISYSLTDD